MNSPDRIKCTTKPLRNNNRLDLYIRKNNHRTLKYKQSTTLVRCRKISTPPTGRIALNIVPNPDKPELTWSDNHWMTDCLQFFITFEPQIQLIGWLVDWLIGCKYGFIPYLQNNWTLHVSTIVTFWNYNYNLPNQPFNQSTIQRVLELYSCAYCRPDVWVWFTVDDNADNNG